MTETIEYHRDFINRINENIERLLEVKRHHEEEIKKLQPKPEEEPHICSGGWCWD